MFHALMVEKFINFLGTLALIWLGLIAVIMCAAVVTSCARYIISMRRINDEESDSETEAGSEVDLGEPEAEVPGQASPEEENPETDSEE